MGSVNFITHADEQQADPTMEQAFITLINDWDKEHTHE